MKLLPILILLILLCGCVSQRGGDIPTPFEMFGQVQ